MKKKLTQLIPDFNPLHLEDISQNNHPSSFSKHPPYELLILRDALYTDDGITYISHDFIIFSNEVYRFDKEDETLNLLDGGFAELYKLIHEIVVSNATIMREYTTEIDLIEDSLYERNFSKIFIDHWFDIKKDLLRFERYYQRVIPILGDFIKFYKAKDFFPLVEMQDTDDEIKYHLSQVQNQLSRLDSIHHYFNSIKNDKLNSNIYFLTLVSAIFLPLNLIVGFFGMNTEDLFFKDEANGTIRVLYILGLSLFISAMGMRIIRFIDTRILKFFLSKNLIYNRMTQKLNNIFKL